MLAAVRIFFTMCQMLSILSKLEPLQTKRVGELWLSYVMDYFLYYFCPENWVLDFDCLFSGLSS